MKTLRLSLSVQVVALLAVVTVPSLALLGQVALERNREALTVDAQETNRLLAQLTTASLSAGIEDARTALSAIGEVFVSPAISDDDARFALASSNLRLARLRLVSLYGGPDVKRVGSMRAAGETASSPALLPDELRVLHFATGGVLKRDGRALLQVAMPVTTGATGPGLWIYGEWDLTPLLEQVRTLGEGPPLGDAKAIFVVDGQRRLVLASDATRLGESMSAHPVFAGHNGAANFHLPLSLSMEFTAEGQARMAALVTVPEPGWAVVVQRSQAQAYETLNALRVAIGGVVLLAAGLILAGGTLGARQLARPLRRLVEAARAIGARTFMRVDPAVSARRDEVGDLARAVDDMSAQLGDSERRLIHETQVRAALSRYLATDVVELAVRDPSLLKLGGEQRLVTVLFADVVGFTRLAESLPAEKVVSLLNELFAIATEIIQQRHGVVDKFVGDSVMAVWGLPSGHAEDASRALDAAKTLRRWVETANRHWKQQYGVDLHLAMGLHTGPAVAGNVGTERRMEYTVVGDTVNLAAKLEASAAPDQILASSETYRACGSPTLLEPIGERVLRGRTQPTLVYEAHT